MGIISPNFTVYAASNFKPLNNYTGVILKDKSTDYPYRSAAFSTSQITSNSLSIRLEENIITSTTLATSIKFNLCWKVGVGLKDLAEPVNLKITLYNDGVIYLSYVAELNFNTNVTDYDQWHNLTVESLKTGLIGDMKTGSSLIFSFDCPKLAGSRLNPYLYIDCQPDKPFIEVETFTKSDIYRYSNKWQRLLQAYRYNGSSWTSLSNWPTAADATKLLKPREHYYTYSITYDYNGGTDSGQSTSTHTYTSTQASFEQTLSNIEPARSGYQFLGWNSAADGSGTPYLKQASISINSDIKLYAIWLQTISITYQKTAELNWAAATIYQDLTGETGPASNITYTITYPDLYNTYNGVKNHSINLGGKFNSESNRDMFGTKLFGYTIGWCKTTVYAECNRYTLSLPVGTKIKVSATSGMDAGSQDTRISLNGQVKAWGNIASAAIYEHTFNKSGDIKFIWKTSGAFVPGLSDTFGWLSDQLKKLGIPGWSTSDDRDSYWDIQITN